MSKDMGIELALFAKAMKRKMKANGQDYWDEEGKECLYEIVRKIFDIATELDLYRDTTMFENEDIHSILEQTVDLANFAMVLHNSFMGFIKENKGLPKKLTDHIIPDIPNIPDTPNTPNIPNISVSIQEHSQDSKNLPLLQPEAEYCNNGGEVNEDWSDGLLIDSDRKILDLYGEVVFHNGIPLTIQDVIVKSLLSSTTITSTSIMTSVLVILNRIYHHLPIRHDAVIFIKEIVSKNQQISLFQQFPVYTISQVITHLNTLLDSIKNPKDIRGLGDRDGVNC